MIKFKTKTPEFAVLNIYDFLPHKIGKKIRKFSRDEKGRDKFFRKIEILDSDTEETKKQKIEHNKNKNNLQELSISHFEDLTDLLVQNLCESIDFYQDDSFQNFLLDTDNQPKKLTDKDKIVNFIDFMEESEYLKLAELVGKIFAKYEEKIEKKTKVAIN